ncbi:MAG TPA: 3-hydroxyacyl-CoA dehydrogenase [Jiangellales bacterium]|nr:3-hydroxyacyl-CoA dehydrogenase [Jiangellales bacterium]
MPPLDTSRPVGVVGAGTMGAGIAQVAAVAGHETLLHDVDAGRAADAVQAVGAQLDRLAATGRLPPDQAAAARTRLRTVAEVDDLAGCGMVVEAVVEDLAVKRELFARLEAVCGPDTVLATNTSSLSVTAVAAGLEHPGRVVGLHFFNPAPVLPLVEVVSGAATTPSVADSTVGTALAWGKTPVRCASTPGFVVNRVARPFYGEAMRVLEERAADPATVDAVLREAGGFRMGPCELTDLIGQDVNHAVGLSVWEQTFQDPRYQPSPIQQRLVDAGWLGRKSARGFHPYGEGVDRPSPRTADPRPAPRTVTVTGGLHVLDGLAERLRAAGVDVRVDEGEAQPVLGIRMPSGAWLVETAGETATAMSWEAPVLALDWALDARRASRFCLAGPDGCPEEALGEAVGLLQTTGAAVSVVDDVPGLLVARTLAMLANEAVDLVHRGEATPGDVDTAMRLGTGYPFDPYAWGVEHAVDVVEVLDALHRAYPTGRYRPSTRLRRLADTAGRSR